MLREVGASSNLRCPGLLDRPPSRTMTIMGACLLPLVLPCDGTTAGELNHDPSGLHHWRLPPGGAPPARGDREELLVGRGGGRHRFGATLAIRRAWTGGDSTGRALLPCRLPQGRAGRLRRRGAAR